MNDRLTITSTVFEEGELIPARYTCDGEKISPPLQITGLPESAKSLAIIVDDPDAPNGVYDHWLVWNIPPTDRITENSHPGTSGANTAGKTGYHPPCPPSGAHRYYFHVFALDTQLDLPVGADRKTLEQVMKKHVLAKGSLMGRYKRSTKA